MISESSRKNITKTKTIRIISERNHHQQQQQPPPAAAIHTYPRTAATIRIISERNLQQQQQPPPKETGNDYTPSAPPMNKSETKRNTL